MREALKLAAHLLATLLALPWLASYAVRRVFLGPDRALEGSTQSLALVPGLPGEYLRRAFLMWTLAECHRSVTIQWGTIFSQTAARIGPNVYVGPSCHLGRVHLERDVLLAAGVHVPSGAQTHGTDDVTRPIREQQVTRRMVRVGEGAWVGSAAVVLADVGKHSVIGAGAVVAAAIPDYVVAAGVPARVLKSRMPEGGTPGS